MSMSGTQRFRSMVAARFTLFLLLVWTLVVSGAEQRRENQDGDSMTRPYDVNVLQQREQDAPVMTLRELQGGSVVWPFHKKNKTNDDKNKTSDDKSCASHTGCYECTTSSYACHWCAFDQACHARGSVHGCAWGTDCKNHTKPDHHKKSKNETDCSAHSTCSECALSSSFCHWCAHDQACHEVGSVYGCVSGVNCYSNDRCKRKNPEPIDKLVIPTVGLVPMMIILAVAGVCICCSTLGYCVAGGVKGAYDDLAAVSAQSSPPVVLVPSRPPTVVMTSTLEEQDEENGDEEDGVEDENRETAPLVQNELREVHDGYSLMPVETSVAPGPARTGSKNMQWLFRCCSLCYILSLVTVAAFLFGSIRYFPQYPVYNICNDAIAWKSLVDSMTSMKVEADFEILVSVMNANHFDAVVDMGTGSFKHDGAFVGSFKVPPTKVEAMSVTDLGLVATFTPDKWAALSLTAEYYKGTLVLEVDSDFSIRVPRLADYSFQATVRNMMVRVNDPALYDRHLCACPEWKDVKNHTNHTFFLN